MNDPFRRPPRFGTTDWAGQKIRAMIDEDDRRKARRSGGSTSQTAQAKTLGAAQATSGEVASDVPVYSQSQTHPFPPPSLALRQTPESRRGLIDSIIAEEGGYSNDPFGGETMFGITQEGIDDYRNRVDRSFNLTPGQISRDQAVQIYDALIKAYRLDQLADPDLRAQVIDMMVNPGIGATGQMLLDVLEQRGHDVRVDPTDNVIGSRTLGVIRDLVNQRDESELAHQQRARAPTQGVLCRSDPGRSAEARIPRWLDGSRQFVSLPSNRSTALNPKCGTGYLYKLHVYYVIQPVIDALHDIGRLAESDRDHHGRPCCRRAGRSRRR